MVFYALIISAFVLQTNPLKMAVNILFISVGGVTILYSYGIFNLRVMSKPCNPNNLNNENSGSRIGALESVVPSESNLRNLLNNAQNGAGNNP